MVPGEGRRGEGGGVRDGLAAGGHVLPSDPRLATTNTNVAAANTSTVSTPSHPSAANGALIASIRALAWPEMQLLQRVCNPTTQDLRLHRRSYMIIQVL